MPDYNRAIIGSNNGGADPLALFDDEFTAEVRHNFKTKSAFIDKTRMKRINDAKGATFSSYGELTGAYLVPGEKVSGQNLKKGETYIPANNLYTASVYIAQIEEAMSNLEDRKEIRNEIAYTLAKGYDIDAARNLIAGARIGSDIDNRPGGRSGGLGTGNNAGITGAGGTIDAGLANANMATVAATLRTGISHAALLLDEDDIPDEDGERYCALRPAQYHLLSQSPGFEMNRDYAGMGSAAMGMIPMIDNVKLFKTNRLPRTDETANTDADRGQNMTDLYQDYSLTQALVFHRSAAGGVQLMDVENEIEYQLERKAHLLMGSYSFGFGILRPECVCELTSAAGV